MCKDKTGHGRKLSRRELVGGVAQLGLLAAGGVVAGNAVAKNTGGSAKIDDSLRAQSSPAGLPDREEFTIRGGTVITMDGTLRKLSAGDVHVRDGSIIAVDHDLSSLAVPTIDARGMIVMPGFVDTHWHLWNAIYRNLVTVQGRYVAVKHELAPHHTAVDFGRAVRLAMLEALDAGITTVHNFAHNSAGPKYADAEIEAMVTSGLRGRFSYGWPDGLSNDKVMPLEDIERVQRDWMSQPDRIDGRLSMGLVARGPQYTEPEVYREELGRARELGLPVTMHAGPFARPVSAARLRDQGFLDSTTILVQYQRATAQDREAMLETGAWNSIGALLPHLRGSIESDITNLVRMVNAGVNTCLSVDATPISTVNMFEIMRSLWHLGVPGGTIGHAQTGSHTSGHGANAGNAGTQTLVPITLEQCLQMATIDGAHALGLGSVTGSLVPGKRADVILVRTTDLNMVPAADPQAALVCSGTVANVDTVIVDGRVLKRGGRLISADVETVKREAAESLEAIRRRSGKSFFKS
jgi:cytosine/adenosine deaminase-related metal-dependent hydrolase